MARFVYRPGLDSLDLVHDLDVFLRAICVNDYPGDVMNLDFDRGNIELHKAEGDTYLPDGIPDVAQFYLLQTILKDVHLDLAETGGVLHHDVWNTFEQNVSRARQDLPYSNQAIVNTVAAYMTLGTFGFRAMIAGEVDEHIHLYLDPANYANQVSRYLRADGDADNDGVSNYEEWQNAAESATSTPQETLDAFVSFALDRTIATGFGEGNSNSQGGTEDCGCPQDLPGTMGRFKLTVDQGVSATAEYPEGSCAAENGVYNVPLGATIKVKADTDSGLFGDWNAPYTQGHRSVSATEYITSTAAAGCIEVEPSMRFFDFVEVQWTGGLDAAGTGEYANLVSRTDISGGVQFTGPIMEGLALSATCMTGESSTWWSTQSNQATAFTMEGAVMLMFGTTARYPLPGFDDCDDKTIHYVGDASGGGLVALAGDGGASSYVGSTAYCVETCYGNGPTLDPKPYPGHEFSKWDHPAELWCSNNYATAEFIPKPELTLSSEACKGYLTACPGKKYYDAVTDRSPQPAVVEVTAHRVPGWHFNGFRGEGTAYRSAREESGECNWSLPSGAIPIPIEGAMDNPIYIKLAQSTTVAAEFKECDCDIDLGDCQKCSGASDNTIEVTRVDTNDCIDSGPNAGACGLNDPVAIPYDLDVKACLDGCKWKFSVKLKWPVKISVCSDLSPFPACTDPIYAEPAIEPVPGCMTRGCAFAKIFKDYGCARTASVPTRRFGISACVQIHEDTHFRLFKDKFERLLAQWSSANQASMTMDANCNTPTCAGVVQAKKSQLDGAMNTLFRAAVIDTMNGDGEERARAAAFSCNVDMFFSLCQCVQPHEPTCAACR